MLKPPAATMPGMTDTLDFVKNLWGSMNLPGANLAGMSAPALSAEDLDKRIADLKAVESWLNMNITMLRGTIQTMEIQRATLATLKSMGASMAEAMRQSGVSTEKMAGMPFGAFFGQPAADAGGAAQPGAGTAPQDPAAALGLPAALAWWNMLQEQFTQAVSTALTPADGAAGTAGAASAASAPPHGDAPPAPAQADAGAAAGGNGKARAGKPKSDKA